MQSHHYYSKEHIDGLVFFFAKKELLLHGHYFKRTNFAIVLWFPSPIIMGGLNLKIYQSFVGTKYFLTLVGEYSSMWGVKLI